MTAKKYERIYKMLENVTPLRADCGVICNKNCCKGDENTGMLLFPFEETALTVKEENGLRVAVCDGTCLRSERPLSCRLFPFFPVMNSEGDIEAVIDIRGYGICPLTEHQSEIKFNLRFLRSVRRVGRILYRDEDTFPFMKKISEEIKFQKELIEKLRG
ncbi:MAG: hypothetical protein ACI4F5_07845 [Acutalibacteraceae bacterium]